MAPTHIGYQLIRTIRHPLREMPKITIPLTQSFLRSSGARWGERLSGLKSVLSAVLSTLRDPRRDQENDPLRKTRNDLLSNQDRLMALEDEIEREIGTIIASAIEDTKP